MKPLPTDFMFKGDHFQQVMREGRVALFRRTSPHRRVSFEVILVQHHDGREAFGTHIPAAEFYPSTSSWGMQGWTFTDCAEADARVHMLCVRDGTRKSEPVRRRSPIPLLVPGGKEVAYPADTVVRLQTLQTKEADTGADPLGDGTFRMYPSGDIVSIDERNTRLARFHQTPKPLNCQEQAWAEQAQRQAARKS